jgi:hypothetical protein
MHTAFEILYDLAIELQVRPQFEALTSHHYTNRAAVEARLRRSILHTLMPGEAVGTRWAKVRIFCRNYVNRAQPAVTGEQMLALLKTAEQRHGNDEERVAALPQLARESFRGPRIQELVTALQQITTSTGHAALGGLSYLEWIESRCLRWVSQPTQDLDADELLQEIRVLSADKPTKIPGMGLPLTANFFADMGLTAFAKPDLHVTPIVNLLTLGSGETEAFCGLIRIAKEESIRLANHHRFAWLQEAGGLRPRLLDRLIYLIGSDNFALDGTKCKRQAPERRRLMRDALISGGLVTSIYQ